MLNRGKVAGNDRESYDKITDNFGEKKDSLCREVLERALKRLNGITKT